MKLSSLLGPVCPLPWGQHHPGSVVWALGASPTCVFPLFLWVGRTHTCLGARPSLWLRLRLSATGPSWGSILPRDLDLVLLCLLSQLIRLPPQ